MLMLLLSKILFRNRFKISVSDAVLRQVMTRAMTGDGEIMTSSKRSGRGGRCCLDMTITCSVSSVTGL